MIRSHVLHDTLPAPNVRASELSEHPPIDRRHCVDGRQLDWSGIVVDRVSWVPGVAFLFWIGLGYFLLFLYAFSLASSHTDYLCIFGRYFLNPTSVSFGCAMDTFALLGIDIIASG